MEWLRKWDGFILERSLAWPSRSGRMVPLTQWLERGTSQAFSHWKSNLLPDSMTTTPVPARRMATLARSPNLAGLAELKINGAMNPEGFGAIFQDPTWAGLRKLDLGTEWHMGRARSALGARQPAGAGRVAPLGSRVQCRADSSVRALTAAEAVAPFRGPWRAAAVRGF